MYSQICRLCGNDKDSHTSQHEPQWVQISYNSATDTYTIDANDYNDITYTDEIPCSFPQCGRGPQLHGSIIKHEYQGKTLTGRVIRFNIPSTVRCETCNIEKGNHTVRHHYEFGGKVVLLNKQEDDRLTIIGDTMGDYLSRLQEWHLPTRVR